MGPLFTSETVAEIAVTTRCVVAEKRERHQSLIGLLTGFLEDSGIPYKIRAISLEHRPEQVFAIQVRPEHEKAVTAWLSTNGVGRLQADKDNFRIRAA